MIKARLAVIRNQLSKLCMLLPVILSANVKAQSGYISFSGRTSAGVHLVDMGLVMNCRYCYIRMGGDIVKYSPDTCDRYAFYNGATYIAHGITVDGVTKRVFLEMLEDGKLKLFCYYGDHGNQYYIGNNDSILSQLVNEESAQGSLYKEVLGNCISDLAGSEKMLQNVAFRRSSLGELVKRYNSGRVRYFPLISAGVTFDLGLGRILPTSTTDPVLNSIFKGFPYCPVTSVSIFADLPVHFSPFSIHPELKYSFFNGYGYNENFPYTYDINFKVHSLSFPVLARYTHPGFKWRPYFEAGPVVDHYFQTSGTVFAATHNGSEITIDKYTERYLLKANQVSLMAEAGLNYALNSKYSVFLAANYHRTLSITNSTTMIFEAFSLSAGIDL